jgi:hypothetical protein
MSNHFLVKGEVDAMRQWRRGAEASKTQRYEAEHEAACTALRGYEAVGVS